MSRSVSIDAMNKISYCLTYHSFLFYISKLLFVTVILYFCIHFHLAPVEGLFFKPKYRANILCICFNFIAVLFLFLSSPWGSVYRFCTVSFHLFTWGVFQYAKVLEISIGSQMERSAVSVPSDRPEYSGQQYSDRNLPFHNNSLISGN